MRPIAVLATLVLLAGCTSDPDAAAQEATAGDVDAVVAVTAAPASPRTVIADVDPVAASVSASRALFARSPVVVLADAADPAAGLLGASAAVGLGVPLLLGGEAAGGVLAPELDRLGVTTVLAVGDAPGAGEGGWEVRAVPAEPGAVAAVTGLDLATADPVAEDARVAAVAALDPAAPTALRPVGADGTAGPASSSSGDGAALPEVQRGEPLAGTLVVTSGSPETLAGVASARAAGAEVRVTGGVTDPRASAELVQRLGGVPSVVVLGADLAAEPGLDWKLDTAATGTQLPGGGQVLFPGRMMVALYGVPGSGALGLLGEQDLPAAIRRAQDMAGRYEPLVDTTVVPAFEIIATVASASAGPDGNYSTESDVEALRPWVEAAGQAGLYVVLDLQPGRTDFLTQAQLYRPLLELPHVGLALDPEWRLRPGEVHLTQIGQVAVDEVNAVAGWLADLTRERRLPQKLLVLHQFQVRMVPDRDRLDLSRDELAVMVHADGQGGQAAKQDTWRVLHQQADQPELAWGWKNFTDEDVPMLTPEETMAQVQPTPQLITYQ
ncbi:hypothetical protein [Modestobacter marinus]|uniref:hypothetical protein n=1 Tax=Modestobacter marinus TaxID=477641 RepID=UPI001C93D1EF|nr:hypothetical protein [Modestobacter marinus]